jgi:hypothetical protein
MIAKYDRSTRLRVMLACAVGSWVVVTGVAEATVLVLTAG